MPDALTVAGWLEEIAQHLLAVDHPRGDWFNEVVALVHNGSSLDRAVSWGGYPAVLRRDAQTAALQGMLDGLPPGTASAAEISRQLAAVPPGEHAAAYIAAHGPCSERAIRRRLAELAPANVIWDLAGGSVA